jgi:acylphosphatase
MALEQRTVHYRGRVQGVGFRMTARAIAQGFDVAGYVHNLPDGGVLLVAEGEAEELDAFLQAITEQMVSYIHEAQVTVRPGSGQFTSFEIRR